MNQQQNQQRNANQQNENQILNPQNQRNNQGFFAPPQAEDNPGQLLAGPNQPQVGQYPAQQNDIPNNLARDRVINWLLLQM